MHLRYVNDEAPGISRTKKGKRFGYTRADGSEVKDPATLRRIGALVIPPAWTNVWICPNPAGHIQATGRDAKGRKQYRYHAEFRRERDSHKYERVISFAEVLPRLRARVTADLRRPKLDRQRVLATVVRLLERTLIRVGNEEYARTNKHFGLTTLRNQHVDVRGEELRFHFRGKSGVQRDLSIRDRVLAALVRRCQHIPGQKLFQYYDADGRRHAVHSHDVNAYLRSVTGDEFSAKDVRTWSGTVLAAVALRAKNAFKSKTEAKRQLVDAVKSVAARLGNTPTVCRNCYIHPAVVSTHLEGGLGTAPLHEKVKGLDAEESLVLALLKRAVKHTPAPAEALRKAA